MDDFSLRPSGPVYDTFVPAILHRFLDRLETSATSSDVWDLMVDLGAGIGLDIVDYVCATDFQNWEHVQFIRTTLPSSWIAEAQDNPEVRKMSTFRQYSVHRLTPIKVGLAYAGDLPDLPPARRRAFDLALRYGLRAGIAIPLRMEAPGQAAHLLFGGDLPRDAFDHLLATHGWTLHAGALSAHTRYSELFKSEFCERNCLTDKQMEILRLVGQGLLDKQIAHDLGISFSTVRQRIASIQAKTGTANRAEVAALAMRVGVVPDPLIKQHDTDLTVFLSTGDGKKGAETRR